MKRQIPTVVAVLVSFLFWNGASAPSQEPKEEVTKKASAWMKTKLQLSQNILTGLTKADFEKIETNAVALNLTNLLEALFKSKRPDYNQQIQLFTFANSELVRQAKAKNLAGAALAYNHLTNSCVYCHQIIRDAGGK